MFINFKTGGVNMINFLLVDDEHFTREGIIENILFEDFGAYHIEQAEDGSAALVKAQNYQPDILITDVRMPIMDGIQLAHKIRELYPECKIIFMSGYSDKEYLKSAIKLKAIEYVEKPIDISELYDSIKKAVNECLDDRARKQSEESITHTLLSAIPILRKELTIELTKQHLVLEAIKEKIALSHLEGLHQSEFVTLLFKILPVDNTSPDLPIYTVNILQNIIETELSYHKLSAIYCFKNDEFLILHLYQQKNTGITMLSHKNIENFCSSLIQKFLDYVKLIIAVGKKAENINDIYFSYQSAVLSMEKGFFTGYGSIIFSNNGDDLCFNFDELLIDKFYHYLVEKQKNTSLSIIKSLSYDLKRYPGTLVSTTKDYFYKLALNVYSIAVEHRLDIWNVDNPRDFLWESIYQLNTLSELSTLLIDLVDKFFNSINQNNMNGTVWEITKYIEKNYSKVDLSIQELSEYTSLTVSYLCVLFKDETGKTINQYLTEFRVKKAKELLKERNYSLTEIATSVGYYDVNYFSKIFKKLTNMSPSKYKERHVL